MTNKTAIFADGFASKVSKSSSLGKVCILEHVTKYGNFLSGSVIKTRGDLAICVAVFQQYTAPR